MTAMTDGLHMLGEGAWGAFWLPLLAWTAVALLALGVLRLWRSAHSLVHYAIRVALMLALPLGLLLAAATDLSFFSLLPSASAEEARVVAPFLPLPIPLSVEDASAFSWTLYHGLGLLTLLAGLLAITRLSILIRHARTLHLFCKYLPTNNAAAVQQTVDCLSVSLGLKRHVQVLVTSKEVVPMTLGWRLPLVVVPEALLSDAEALRLALLHELTHIRRRDVLLQSIEQVVGALFMINPVVLLLRRSIATYREMACDAEVLAQPRVSSKRYAALLYRFVTPHPLPRQFTLNMASSEKQLKNRILAMKSIGSSAHGSRKPKYVSVVLAGLLLSSATLIVACTDLVDTNVVEGDAVLSTAEREALYEDAYVVVEEMPELIGGLAAIQEELTYPASAKEAGVEGRVILQFIVDENGVPVAPAVVRGVGSGLDEEAIRALQNARFKPGRQDGKPVNVKMSIPVTFKLSDDAASTGKRVHIPLLEEQMTFTHPQLPEEEIEAFMKSLYEELKIPYQARVQAVGERLINDATLSDAERTRLETELKNLRAEYKERLSERYEALGTANSGEE